MSDLKNFTLLYVEDDVKTASIMTEILTEKVKELYIAYDGYQGLKVFKEKKPDIVVTDINMPKMNGITLCKKIKEISPETPIVIVTAYNENNLLHQSIELGVDAYITKPIISIDKIEQPIDKIATVLNYKHLVKQTELALKKSEQNLRKAQEVAKLGSWEFNFEYNKLICSNEVFKIFELEEPHTLEIHYDVFFNLIHPDDLERVKTQFNIINIQNSTNNEIQYRLLMKNGQIKYVTTKFNVESNKTDKPIIVVGTIQDISESCYNELKIKEQKEKLEVALEASKIGLWEWDIANNKITWDHNSYKMLGYSDDEFTIDYDLWRSFVHTDDQEKVHSSIHFQLSYRDNFVVEYRYKTKSGEWLWVEGRGKVIDKDNQGKAIRLIGTHADISHTKEYEFILEQEISNKTKELKQINLELEDRINEEVEKSRQKDVLLQQQTRLAAIGEMMSNIAHQWRQPLSAITTAISGLKVKKDYGLLVNEDIDEANESILHSSSFLSNTIDNFRNFFRKDVHKKQFFVIDAIKDTIEIVKASYEHHFIEIEYDMDDTICFFGSDNFLSQVILNILTNAKDAFLDKEIQRRIVFIKLFKNQDIITICIKDNAGGVPDNLVNKIFDPYFTTKSQSQGTGLGLYMCVQILHNHFNGGTIEIINTEDENGLGACFIIKFSEIIAKDTNDA